MMKKIGMIATAVLLSSLTIPAKAQVFVRPNPMPLVTAENAQWFAFGEPLTFSGSFYYPAGPRVFFDGNLMTRVGTYRGIPLYADATLEPFSVVLVPLSGGLMQPYERRRENALAGTTGSRPPSFPINTPAEPVTDEFAPDFAVSRVSRPAPTAATTVTALAAAQPTPGPNAAPAASARESATRGTSGLMSRRQPAKLQIWIEHQGGRWHPAGAAVPFEEDRFRVAGEYRGFPVFAQRNGSSDLIYVPASQGALLTPYRRQP